MMTGVSLMVFYSSGIILCFFYCGVLQEKMVKESCGKNVDLESFIYCITFICMQCFVNYIYSILLQKTCMNPGENRTSSPYYWTCAITYLIAMICSIMSLDWISYPVQVLGKSCKPIPVMCTSVFLNNKSYPTHKYVFVFLLIIGVMLFMNDNKQSTNVSQNWFGEILLVISLVMDGFTAAIQDQMLQNYKTKGLHMMANINKWSLVYLLLIVFSTGEVFSFFYFIFDHPNTIWDLFKYSVVSAQGQVFLFVTIEHFGALFSSVVTTLRKVFSVYVSVLYFGHSLLPRQWLATVLIFLALLLDSVWKSYCKDALFSLFMYLQKKYSITKKDKFYFKENEFWV